MTNRDWYLNQLGITQFVLRKPVALKGEAITTIDSNIKLLVITKNQPKQKIFFDILKAINLNNEQFLHLTPAQLIMPLDDLEQVIWFIDEALPESWLNNANLAQKALIQTSSLDELSQSPQQKRQLWQTLCQYDHYFKSN
ncbi:DNA polymerase III subunit psi [Orbaceae bacterium ac157xtp]